MIEQITPNTAKSWLEKGEACLIDVRELAEYQQNSIKGSILIPRSDISADKLPEEYKGKKIIIHCQMGGRSNKACSKLEAEDPSLKLYNMQGGILAWQECGYETDKKISSGNKLSIENQIRILIGAVIIISSLLTFYNPKFIIITLLTGFGLFISGITNICMMAKFLAKMPWNKNN